MKYGINRQFCEWRKVAQEILGVFKRIEEDEKQGEGRPEEMTINESTHLKYGINRKFCEWRKVAQEILGVFTRIEEVKQRKGRPEEITSNEST